MKKTSLFACFVLCCLCAQAQDKTVFGVKTGLNVSILSASVNSDASPRTGFHFGMYLKKPLATKFFFRPELYYAGQGQKDDYRYSPGGPSIGSTTTTLNYLNLPLLFEVGRKVSFQFGPQLGFLLSAKEKGTINNEPIDDDLREGMKKFDLSVVAGLGFSPGRFSAGIRMNIGLTGIFKAEGVTDIPGVVFPEVKNRTVHFYVGYSF